MAKAGFRRQDKRERNSKVMVFFMAFIMVGSVFGVIFFGYNQEENKVNYNDFLFIEKNNLWTTRLNGKEAFFNYLPDDVINIELKGDILSRLGNIVEIDIASEFNSSLKGDIALVERHMVITLSNFNVYVRTGFTSENEFGTPVISCKDATANVPVVYFKESNQTKVYLDGDCIIAEGRDGFDIFRIKDRLMYAILGILK